MPMLEIGLGVLCAVAGGGAGWMGRGKLEARMRNDAAMAAAAKSARRVAGGKKAAQTRKDKGSASANVNKEASKHTLGGDSAGLAQQAMDMGLVQRQQFQDAQTGISGAASRGNGAMYGGE